MTLNFSPIIIIIVSVYPMASVREDHQHVLRCVCMLETFALDNTTMLGSRIFYQGYGDIAELVGSNRTYLNCRGLKRITFCLLTYNTLRSKKDVSPLCI